MRTPTQTPAVCTLEEWHAEEFRKWSAAGCPRPANAVRRVFAECGLEGPPVRTLYYDGRF